MKRYYSYNPKSFTYVGTGICQISPKDGEYLLPANATFIPIPDLVEKDKIPLYDKNKKKWELTYDDKYLKHQEQKKLEEEIKKNEEINKMLNEVDDFNIRINYLKDGKVLKRKIEDIKKDRVLAVKRALINQFKEYKNKFVELTCVCMTDLSKNTENNRIALKEFKDNIEQVWNSIDGRKKPKEITWPDMPNI